MSSVLNVYKRILLLYRDNYLKSSGDFKKGFTTCLELFKIGIKKEEQYNLNLRVYELEQLNHAKDVVIRKQRQEVLSLRKQVSSTSFISGMPLDVHKYYEIGNIVKEDGIKLVVNMDKETFLMFWRDFTSRYKWTQVDECKSKLISFINRYESQGFKAYKDIKTAQKEGVRI